MFFKQICPLILLLLTFALPNSSMADHSWGKYKWKPSSIPFNLDLVDNVNLDWEGHLLLASGDWSVSTVLGTTVVSGSTDPISCDPRSGNIQVCNAAYGDTGWLGVAQIYGRGTTITAGVAMLNDTYYATGYANGYYDTPAWRRMVMCQEIAHTFGLAHQDETFDNVNLGTCMDYTDDPDGTIGGESSNEYPNQHDYDQLEAIYGGSKVDKEDGGCNPKSPKCNSVASYPGNSAHGHAQWGRLVSGHGGVETYEKDLGNGIKLITHVIWTLEHADNH
jgi:hypothetical protein